MKNNISMDYLQELQKLNDSLIRLQLRIEKHISKMICGHDATNEEKAKLLTRAEAAKYLGISARHFDRISKLRHYWRYHNCDGTGLYFSTADFNLSVDEANDKWVNGFLSKQIDENCNVILRPDPSLNAQDKRRVQELLKTIKKK